MNEDQIARISPILSLKQDRRVGSTKSCLSLYATSRQFLYFANDAAGKEEYIIPLQSHTLSMLAGIVENGDTETPLLEQLKRADPNFSDDCDDDEITDLLENNPANYQDDMILLETATDRIWGIGPDSIGKVSKNGIPYILMDGLCMVFDAATFRMAFDLLRQDTPASIQSMYLGNESLVHLIKQGDLTLRFHTAHSEIPDIRQQLANIVIATPIMLKGRHNGKHLKAEI